MLRQAVLRLRTDPSARLPHRRWQGDVPRAQRRSRTRRSSPNLGEHSAQRSARSDNGGVVGPARIPFRSTKDMRAVVASARSFSPCGRGCRGMMRSRTTPGLPAKRRRQTQRSACDGAMSRGGRSHSRRRSGLRGNTRPSTTEPVREAHSSRSALGSWPVRAISSSWVLENVPAGVWTWA